MRIPTSYPKLFYIYIYIEREAVEENDAALEENDVACIVCEIMLFFFFF